jgi:hypothetical protein
MMSGHGATHTSYERQEGPAANVKQEKLKIDKKTEGAVNAADTVTSGRTVRARKRNRADRGQLVGQ